MADVTGSVIAALRARAAGRRLRVGIFGRSDVSAAAAVLMEGHRTVVMSDRFRFLFSLSRRVGTGSRGCFTLVETAFRDLPVPRRSLDALVLVGGMRAGATPLDTLVGLRELLVPGGLLVWPHPVTDGSMGRLGRTLSPFRRGMLPALPRERLCSLAMAAGYAEVGQRAPKGGGVLPWVVTTGIAGMCGW